MAAIEVVYPNNILLLTIVIIRANQLTTANMLQIIDDVVPSIRVSIITFYSSHRIKTYLEHSPQRSVQLGCPSHPSQELDH
jgi:hypothetical protein